MVELALVLPLLLLILTGILAFGIALNNFLVLTNAVNIGAQLLAISRGQTTDPCATAATAIDSAAPNLSTTSLSLTFVLNGTTYSGTSCTAGAAKMTQGATAQVTATYPCTLAIAGINYACSLQAQTAELIQ